MRYLFLFLLVGNGLFLSAQKNLEGGLIGGGLYYLGDINPNRHFYSTKLGGGLFMRQNLNKRWGIRADIIAGTLSADDNASSSNYQKVRNLHFNTPLLEIVTQFEFNFLPYKLGTKRNTSPYTPYFATGLGFLLVTNSVNPYNVTLPLSLGLKLAVTKKLEVGVEWSFRKTFSDYIDNLSGDTYDLSSMENKSSTKHKQMAFFYGKDWYSFAGIFITYKIFQQESVCKAYDF